MNMIQKKSLMKLQDKISDRIFSEVLCRITRGDTLHAVTLSDLAPPYQYLSITRSRSTSLIIFT